ETGAQRRRNRKRLYPDELEPGLKYIEGARKQVRVNAYERNTRARTACLKHYGYRCAVCKLLFEERYGSLGKGFIHIHHLKPLALAGVAMNSIRLRICDRSALIAMPCYIAKSDS